MKNKKKDVPSENAVNSIIMKKPVAPTLHTIERIFELYPTLERRGWTPEFIATLVEKDVIGGIIQDQKPKQLLIIEQSLVAFIDYHDRFLSERANAINENIETMKENDKIKKESQKKK